jgi:hypothetical protein
MPEGVKTRHCIAAHVMATITVRTSQRLLDTSPLSWWGVAMPSYVFGGTEHPAGARYQNDR